MNALVQDEANGELHLREVETPKPNKGEVLIKMAFSPINPSDLAQIEGSYAEGPSYPLIPGIEGSGRVVGHGGGILPKLRMGKRVSCTSTKGKGGLWSEYVVTSAMHCVPLKSHISFEEGASLLVNPLSALAFIDLAKEGKHTAIVNTAAASSLGKMLIRMAISENIPLINIVRRRAQKKELEDFGAQYVLDSSESNFEESLQKLASELNADLIFDAVTGELTPTLLRAAPKNSTIYLYAKLDSSLMQIDQRQIVQQGKVIKGFFLGEFSKQKSILKSLSDIKKVQKMVGKEIQTKIHKIIPLNEAMDGLEGYKKEMTKGKVLFKL